MGELPRPPAPLLMSCTQWACSRSCGAWQWRRTASSFCRVPPPTAVCGPSCSPASTCEVGGRWITRRRSGAPVIVPLHSCHSCHLYHHCRAALPSRSRCCAPPIPRWCGVRTARVVPAVLGATPIFWLPGIREISLWLGAVDASRHVAEKQLREGRSLIVYPGYVWHQ
jgi:hypothetical protein